MESEGLKNQKPKSVVEDDTSSHKTCSSCERFGTHDIVRQMIERSRLEDGEEDSTEE